MARGWPVKGTGAGADHARPHGRQARNRRGSTGHSGRTGRPGGFPWHRASFMALLGCAYAGVLLIRPAALASIDTWVGLLLLVAAAFVGTCAGSVYLRLPFQPMAHVALDVWDFSTSWATNLTAVGALFGTVLAAALPLPKPHQSLLTKDAYTGLFLFFGAVLVVGTFFYYATRGLTGDEAAGGAARAARRHVPPPARVRVPPSPPLPADACERPALHRCPVSAA